MFDYKISVIIPIYNADSTLKRAIDPVINQSIGFNNIELILHDDASNDKSRDIILDFASKFENIVPIFTNNNSGSPAKGRNEGIKKAHSDFIMFLDSDDEYCEDICETLYNEIIQEKADIVCCNNITIDSKHFRKNMWNYKYNHYKNDNILEEVLKEYPYKIDYNYLFEERIRISLMQIYISDLNNKEKVN